MKKLIFILLSILFLACGSTRSTSSEKTQIRNNSDQKKTESVTTQSDSTITDKSKINNFTQEESVKQNDKHDSIKTVYRYYLFDTSKPLINGIPQIQALYENIINSYSSDKSKETDTKTLKHQIENDIRKEYEDKFNKKLDNISKVFSQQITKKKEISIKKQINWKLYIYLFLAVLIIGIIIYLRKKLKIFDFIKKIYIFVRQKFDK